MKKYILFFLFCFPLLAIAKENVGVNTTTPNFNLDVRGSDNQLDGGELQLGTPDETNFLRFFGGLNWENVTGSLPNVPVNSLSYGTGNGAGIYAGTDIGIFFRGDGMSDWIYFGNGFPNVRVFDMEIEDGYLYAGTFGRGIWRSPVYTSCPGILTLTPSNQPGSAVGIQYNHASNQITSTRIIDGGFATEVFYQAGNRIDLLPGFEGRSGNFLEAKIGGCPD